MIKNNFTTQIKTIAFFLCLILIPSQFSSADEADIKKFVGNIADNIIKVVKNQGTSKDYKANKLLKIIKTNFDTPWMSKFALGRDYKTLSSSDKKKYKKLYEHYLRNTYFPILMKYNNESYNITKVVKTAANHYTVAVRIMKPGRSPIDMDYTVKYQGGEYKLLDMSIEGVSTIFTQRSEFSTILKQSGTDALFKKLSETEIEVY
jgi:phospholipid transport system substrate-binding protein